jgi:single-strand DNA-binding protein
VANDINRVILIGRLTRDPELRQTGTGTSYCRFSIANNRNYTANGERKEEVSFFNCVAWGKQAEIINQYTRKGKQVAIDGRLQQRSYQGQDGKTQSVVDVVVERLQFIGAPDAQGGGDSFRSGPADYQPAQPAPDYGSQGGGFPGDYNDFPADDDIPF